MNLVSVSRAGPPGETILHWHHCRVTGHSVPLIMGPWDRGIRGINIANQVYTEISSTKCVYKQHVLYTTRDCVICCLLDRLSNDPGAEGGSWNVQKSRLANEKLFQGLTCVIVRPAASCQAGAVFCSVKASSSSSTDTRVPKFQHQYIHWRLITPCSNWHLFCSHWLTHTIKIIVFLLLADSLQTMLSSYWLSLVNMSLLHMSSVRWQEYFCQSREGW